MVHLEFCETIINSVEIIVCQYAYWNNEYNSLLNIIGFTMQAASAGKLDGKFTIAGQSGTVECHFTYEAGAACSPPTFTYTHVCGRLTLIIVGDKPSTHNGSAYVTVMIFG